MRCSKFSPGSRMPAYLPITDIAKSGFAGNPFLTSRPFGGVHYFIKIVAIIAAVREASLLPNGQNARPDPIIR